MATKGNDLGRDSIGRLLFKLAVPAVTAQLVNMLYNIVDRMYIGHLPDVGSTALTGVGVTMPVIILVMAFSSLIGMGGAPQAAIRMGQGRNDEAERILGNCTTMVVVLAVVLTGVFLGFGEPLLLLFGASEETLPFALEYLNIYMVGTIFVMIALGLNSFITTQGFATTSMLTVVIGAVINIALDPILMFGFDMGVRGAALATILSQGVSAAWVLRFLCGKKTKLRIRREYLRVSPKVIAPVLALGVSPFIMQSTESILNICFNASLQRYGGDLAVGAMAILASVMQVFTLPLMGLTQGAQPIVSYNYGAGDRYRVKKTFQLLLISALSFTVLFWAVDLCFPQLFVYLFSEDAELLAITSWALRIYLGAGLVMGAQMACQQTFVAVGQAKVSLFLALLRKVILLIPLIYILPLFFEDKVFAVFFAEPVADVLATATTVVMFSIKFRKILAAMPDQPKHVEG